MQTLAERAPTALGLLIAAGGGVKFFPDRFPSDMAHHMRQLYRDCARATPLKLFGIVPDTNTYTYFFGVTEVALGGMLAFGSRPIQRYSCMGLMGVMLYGTQSVITAGHPAMAFVPLSMLGLLLYVYTVALDPEPKDKK